MDDVEVGTPLNTLMLKEELHGLELLDKRPESKEEQPASKQPLSERSEEEKPKGNALPDKVDVTASFPGGERGRMQFLRQNLNYPDEDRAAGRVGKVFVEVVVEADGRLTNARIAEGATPSMNDEALRLVGLMPPWEPAQKNGKSVRSKVLVQIPFTLR
ncbi:MAG TPA: TonB family protein [Flavobacteriales bacterium]|nr:TonB family protein [Flavobacteriales bacterium]